MADSETADDRSRGRTRFWPSARVRRLPPVLSRQPALSAVAPVRTPAHIGSLPCGEEGGAVRRVDPALVELLLLALAAWLRLPSGLG